MTNLKGSDKELFFNKGYLIKENIISNQSIDRIKNGLQETIIKIIRIVIKNRQEVDYYMSLPFETCLSELYEKNIEAAQLVLKNIRAGNYRGEAMLEAIRNPNLVNFLTNFLGKNITASSIYRVRPKIPNYPRGEVPWHQDAGYQLPHCDKKLVITCWIPLVESTIENGCLWVAPNMHKEGILEHFTGGPAGFLEIPRKLITTQPIPVEIKAGSVLFMTQLTPHASFRNYSKSIRWSLDIRYQDFEVPSNVGFEPNSYFKNREEVNMACSPSEAYIIVKDSSNPNNEMKDPEEFAKLRMDWEIASKKMYNPSVRWKSK